MPYLLKVIVGVGSDGDAELSCRVNTSMRLIVRVCPKTTRRDCGDVLEGTTPLLHPPPASQPLPLRSPSMAASAG
jgi:hypothetical protein